MTRRTFSAAIVAVLAWPAAAPADEAGAMTLSADAAVFAIEPRAAGRKLVDLPPLEYTFRMQARCADDATPASFALNVADTRITLNQSQLAADAALPAHELLLTVPAEQLAPIALTSFCVADAADDVATPGSELLIPAVLAAHASLLCTSNTSQKMTYLSTPLDLRLRCNAPPPADAAAPPD